MEPLAPLQTTLKLRPGKTFGGYTVLTDGKITRAAITTDPGNVMVCIVLNEELTKYQFQNNGMTVFDNPLVVTKGDIIKIQTIASSGTSGNVIGGNVSLLMELI